MNKLSIQGKGEITQYSWIIPLVMWGLLYVYRPFFLGFYHDDWNILIYMPLKFYPETYSQVYPSFPDPGFYFFINFYSNRPLTGLVSWLLSFICHDSPYKWHFAVILTNLATAWSIRLLVRNFLTLIDENKKYLGDIAATFWLILPWSMAINTWPTLIPNQLTIICFSLSGYFLFGAWKDHKIGWFRPALFFLLSCLSYESFYGQFIIYILIGFIYGIHKKNGAVSLMLPLLGFGFSQALVILFNRFGGVLIQHAVRKTLNKDWLHLWLSSLNNLPATLLESFTTLRSFVTVILVIGILVFILACFEQFMGHSQQKKIAVIKAFLALLSFMLGGIIAVAVYSVAGYPMFGIGLASRVTLSLSFWLILMLIPASLIIINSRLFLRRAGLIVAISGLLFMSGATTIQLQSWIKSWDIQQDILASAPLNKMQKIKANSFVLLEGYPQYYQGVIVFENEWDINSAMNYSYALPSNTRFIPLKKELVISWDGQTLQQISPNYWKFSYEGDEVWIWNYQNQSFRKVTPPARVIGSV